MDQKSAVRRFRLRNTALVRSMKREVQVYRENKHTVKAVLYTQNHSSLKSTAANCSLREKPFCLSWFFLRPLLVIERVHV